MNARLDNPLTEADPLLRGVLITTLAVAAIGVLLLVRATFGGGVDHVTVRVDNQAALVLQVDTIDASGATVGLGVAAPKTLTTFQEIPDIGQRWTFVASYGSRQVHPGGHDQGRAGRTRLDGLDPRRGHHRARGGRLAVSHRGIPARPCRLAHRSRAGGGRHGAA
jgi:hypothetical protein